MIATALPENECHAYYHPYVNLLDNTALLPALQNGVGQMEAFLATLKPDDLQYAYENGKWTVAEVLMHIVDTERIFQYRALRFARNDKNALIGFEQDDFVLESGAGQKTKSGILKEYKTVRAATLALFESFDERQLQRLGMASNAAMSVRALGFVIAGHQLHHTNILRQRYV